MQNARDVLKKMAFNINSRESTQEAFLKALQNALMESEKAEVIPVAPAPKTKKLNSLQLEFDLESISEPVAKKIG